MSAVPKRVRALNDASVAARGQYVLYWMVATRRPRYNFALEHAARTAEQLKKPLVVLEALRVGYPWASERLHGFVLDGMADNAAYFAQTPARYYAYVEREEGGGSGLLEALADKACLVVTDDYPCFFIPRMTQAAAARLRVKVEAVDSNGVLPIASAEGRSFFTAFHFRRFMQQSVEGELALSPLADPLRACKLPRLDKLPRGVEARWPELTAALLEQRGELIASLPIDLSVRRVSGAPGGFVSAQAALERFLERRLSRYADGRSHPDDDAQSGLSAYLHFGHLSTHEILESLFQREGFDGKPRGERKDGSREGFWGLSRNAEALLDELITWRELAFNTSANLKSFDKYESLPTWAKATLDAHASNPREHLYDLDAFEQARTHDPVWNAAQRQLVRDGRIHNYLRMLWGKKILEWSSGPELALERMIDLNNKYALDGRDPNSYAGIFWVLGRYDRPWAPERPVFGTVRFMSSQSTVRKLRVSRYLEKFGTGKTASLFAEP